MIEALVTVQEVNDYLALLKPSMNLVEMFHVTSLQAF
ncbi:hypothetical protein BDGGKGIB_01852 [Nodularia sphaerocarpa UHCC 0038]|nr:hypothetical protein BDGGKGIB_01852 [Nodularia sphaerocarpa UHCC 0038]